MENNKKKECAVFEGERIALPAPRRGGFYIRIRTVALFCIFIVAVVFVCAKNGAFDELLGFFGNVWGAESESETNETEVTEITSNEVSETESVIEESCNESTEILDTETEASEEISVISLDLSEAEKGPAYIVNYTGQKLDAEGIFEMGFGGGRYSYTERPVVMILHTHTSEGYYDFDNNEPLHSITKSVVAVGERIANNLNKNGIPTVHCTVIHDGDDEIDPYESAAKTIKTMLDIYPSIEYVIDIHRLSEYGTGEGTVRTDSGTGSAQVRLTVSSEGVLTRDSLALAMHMRSRLNREGQRICMPVVYTDSEYNSWMSAYYLKIDVGAKGNLAEEAFAAGDLLSEALTKLLKK